jgi:hypothetical protein
VGFFKLEQASGSGEWTFYIAEGNVPRGTAIAMLFAGLDFSFESLRMSCTDGLPRRQPSLDAIP